MTPLILIGGGGHCRSVIDAAQSAGMPILGILDNNLEPGTLVSGYPVLGPDTEMASYAQANLFVLAVGQIKTPAIRRRLAALGEAAGASFTRIIAADAYVSPGASLGSGTAVMHKAVVNACATIGSHCIVNTSAIVEHDATVGDFTHIATGAIVNGGARIGSGCLIGSHATVLQGVTICNDVVVAAGAVVRRDITTPGTFFGH